MLKNNQKRKVLLLAAKLISNKSYTYSCIAINSALYRLGIKDRQNRLSRDYVSFYDDIFASDTVAEVLGLKLEEKKGYRDFRVMLLLNFAESLRYIKD